MNRTFQVILWKTTWWRQLQPDSLLSEISQYRDRKDNTTENSWWSRPSNIFPDPISSKNTVEDLRGVLEQQQQDGHAEQAEVLAVEQPVHCHQRHGLQHGQHHLRGPARQPRHQGLRGNWHSVGFSNFLHQYYTFYMKDKGQGTRT